MYTVNRFSQTSGSSERTQDSRSELTKESGTTSTSETSTTQPRGKDASKEGALGYGTSLYKRHKECEEIIKEKEIIRDSGLLQAKHPQMIAMVSKALMIFSVEKNGPMKVLELGCGDGSICGKNKGKRDSCVSFFSGGSKSTKFSDIWVGIESSREEVSRLNETGLYTCVYEQALTHGLPAEKIGRAHV